jgi:tetratricopeptide (TPR) repeat protein
MTAHPSRTLGPIALLLCTVGVASAASPGAGALALCRRAATLAGPQRAAELTSAVAAAEAAIAQADDDPDAHFALFCALGLQLQDDGLSFATLSRLRRAFAAVDRALELDPNHVPALVGKGAALIATPRLAGGDPVRGLRLLQQALERDPDNATALRYLAEATGRDVRVASRR